MKMRKAYYTLAVFLLLLGIGLFFLPEREHPDEVSPRELLGDLRNPSRFISTDKVAEMINFPDDHCIGPLVVIGKGVKEPWPKPGQLPLDEVVIHNRFS